MIVTVSLSKEDGASDKHVTHSVAFGPIGDDPTPTIEQLKSAIYPALQQCIFKALEERWIA